METLECFNEIIGLSQTECECLTDLLPDDSTEPTYNVSRSGIYLDKLEGFNINIAGGADDCAKGNIWERMADAVETAKADFTRNMLGCVAQNYQPRLKNFSWQLGQSTFSGSLNSIVGSHVGMRISPLQLKGGFIYIKRIGVLINQSAPVTLQVWSDLNGGTMLFENSSTPLNAVANTLTWASLSDPLELPMWDSSGHLIRYYVFILMNGTFKPKSNKKDCGCNGSRRPYDKWLDIIGVSGSDTSNLLGFKTDGTYLNGITLDVDVKCKSTEVICSSEFPLDFEQDGNAMNLAVAIQLKAGAILYKEIYNSDNINRFTMMSREQIKENYEAWDSQYQAAIIKLCEDINIEANDCMICKITKTSLIKNTILS